MRASADMRSKKGGDGKNASKRAQCAAMAALAFWHLVLPAHAPAVLITLPDPCTLSPHPSLQDAARFQRWAVAALRYVPQFAEDNRVSQSVCPNVTLVLLLVA